jgi:hypothetical protein
VKTIDKCLSALLALLFSYTAMSKMLAFGQFEAALSVQPLTHTVANTLAFLLPVFELTAACLLIFSPARLAGYFLSCCLMAAFTGYAALAVSGYWPQTPCICGGILGKMGWGAHLVLNSFFLLVTITGIYFTLRERRTSDA